MPNWHFMSRILGLRLLDFPLGHSRQIILNLSPNVDDKLLVIRETVRPMRANKFCPLQAQSVSQHLFASP